MIQEDGFPLFLLDIVLLPTESTTLHVFEDRYKELAARCLEGEQQFGVVRAAGEGVAGEWGCATQIEEVVERYDDGRLDILVTGVEPIRVIEMENRFSYPSGRVERISDEPAGYAEPEQAARTRAKFVALLKELRIDAIDPEELSTLSAYEMAARIRLDPDDKEMLLELRDEGARLANLERIFTTAVRSVGAARKMAAHAQTNGHVRKS